jgi:hypothetical protein
MKVGSLCDLKKKKKKEKRKQRKEKGVAFLCGHDKENNNMP